MAAGWFSRLFFHQERSYTTWNIITGMGQQGENGRTRRMVYAHEIKAKVYAMTSAISVEQRNKSFHQLTS